MTQATLEQQRAYWHQTWHLAKRAPDQLNPLQRLMIQVMEAYPQWHDLLDQSQDAAPTSDFTSGAYLQMGLHLALLEQLQSDHPQGIRAVYQRLSRRHSPQRAEAMMADVLFHCLQDIGKRGHQPQDQDIYLKALQALR